MVGPARKSQLCDKSCIAQPGEDYFLFLVVESRALKTGAVFHTPAEGQEELAKVQIWKRKEKEREGGLESGEEGKFCVHQPSRYKVVPLICVC